ncbi:hypothetical protein DLJ49_10500 [Rhodovulum sp. 12E13]|uniref:hypothetical protein n=1 Tax=Rhodovulum sp. 12E13 TaxID=2203891 RepID=UPI000E15F31F|nr:hypothetical protein [Rhodovulum sp. 12E13]RDC72336.1 hypothetical protein DLJ49_10500 [Rhodovulum sp. 12E13]
MKTDTTAAMRPMDDFAARTGGGSGAGRLGDRPEGDPLRARTETSGRSPATRSASRRRQAPGWQDHPDINEVVLATAALDAWIATSGLGPLSRSRPADGEPDQA